MVDNNLMYRLYTEENNFKIKKLLEENMIHIENHKQLSLLLQENKLYIDRYCNNDLETILKSTNVNLVSTFPVIPVYDNGKKINFKAITLYIDRYLWCNSLITKVKSQHKELQQRLVSKVLYNRILNSFNRKITDKIIEENYTFEAVPSFGKIYIIKNENHCKRVDWGKSNANKAKILAKGGIPYLKKDEDTYMYKGEKWLEYHDPIDFFFHWGTKWITKELNPFIKDYKFKPARGNYSIVTKLQQVKQDKERCFALYTNTL